MSEEDKKTVLQEAQSLVYGGERHKEYGHPRDNMQHIAHLWNGWLAAKGVPEDVFRFKSEDVPDLHILTKMARFNKTNAHRDSHVDIAGYAGVRARVLGIDD